mgnify:CR=1 FL=1
MKGLSTNFGRNLFLKWILFTARHFPSCTHTNLQKLQNYKQTGNILQWYKLLSQGSIPQHSFPNVKLLKPSYRNLSPQCSKRQILRTRNAF